MRSDMRPFRVEGVKDTYRVRLDHVVLNLCAREPPNLRRLFGSLRLSAYRPTQEDESDHAALHVLVHAREPYNLGLDATLFEDLTGGAVFRALINLQDTPRCFPSSVVSTPNHEDPAVFADDHARH